MRPAVGKFVKVNDTWLEVVGVLREQHQGRRRTASGGEMEDPNNIIYVPFNTFQYRFWDMSAYLKDELDGIDMRLKPGADSIEVAKVVNAILNSDPQQHAGLHRHDSRRLARPAAANADDLHLRNGRDRRDLAAGRRHRDHEYRARDGDGADARDRRPPRNRRAADGHPAAVSDRVRADLRSPAACWESAAGSSFPG